MDRTVLLLMLCLQAFLLTTTFTSADESTPLKYKQQSSDLVSVDKRTWQYCCRFCPLPGQYGFPINVKKKKTRYSRLCSDRIGGCGPMEKVNVEKRTSENRDTDSAKPGEHAFPVEGTIMLTRERREDETQTKKKRSYDDCSVLSGGCGPMEKVNVEKRTRQKIYYCCRFCPLPGQYGFPVNVEKRTSENRDTDSAEPGEHAFPVEGTIMLTRERREDETKIKRTTTRPPCSDRIGGCGPMEKVNVEKRTSENRDTDSAKPGEHAFPDQ
ncbi:uncharacterized protein LOC130178259 isoform X1 [Seriola aureovittata]|uniref:uncharacterized protein LOC130178259 isoform X1 n=1 Tax=Seriola aureovittata TaxID=2871759 RepID=UPI0024BEBE96|nr:uncharacterized protein LOC130178259 isoform X1 [Seriola aureovittata]